MTATLQRQGTMTLDPPAADGPVKWRHATLLVRTVFVLPLLWGAVNPLRFIKIHPTPFAEARTVGDYRNTSYFLSLNFLIITVFATLLSHIYEAGRRHKRPKHPSGKVSDANAPDQPASSRCFTWSLDAKDMRVWTSFDATEALVHGALLAIAMVPDVAKRYPKVAGVFTLGFALLPIVEGFMMKRIMYGVTEVQGSRMSSWVNNTAMLVLKTVAFNLLLLLGYGISSVAYPYDLDTSALNQWLHERNHSSLRCDDEATFWATFQLPYTLLVGVDRTIECDEPLCGYRDWTALCQAVRNVGVHFTSSYAMMVTLLCSVFLAVIFFVLGGSGRISHNRDGSLDVKRLLAPHILVILACTCVMAILTLLNVARLMVTSPLLLFAAMPGFEAESLALLGEAKWNSIMYVLALPCPVILGGIALALLPVDALESFIKSRRNQKLSYFLSYKQDDGNDGAVQMLANQLRYLGAKSVWLDKLAENRSTTGMTNGVEESDVFVAVISPAYFTSYFCCLEIHTALKQGKRIQVVWNQSKHTVQTALGWIPEKLHFLKGNELLPIHEDVQMARPCVENMLKAETKPLVVKDEEIPELQKEKGFTEEPKPTPESARLSQRADDEQDLEQRLEQGVLQELRQRLKKLEDNPNLEQRLKNLEDALERPLALGRLDDYDEQQ